MEDDSVLKKEGATGGAPFRCFSPEQVFGEVIEGDMPQFNVDTEESITGDLEDDLVTKLNSRVFDLERKVDTLESELRMVRRKVRAMDVSRYGYDIITETVQRVLNDNSWNISRNKSRRSFSSDDEEESFLQRKHGMKHRHKLLYTKRKVFPNPKAGSSSITTVSRQQLPKPGHRPKRKYKESDNENEEQNVLNPEDELNDEENYQSKPGKRQFSEKHQSDSNVKPKGEVSGSGILKNETPSPNNRPLSERKILTGSEDTSCEDFKRISTTGRKPSGIWEDFLTKRDDNGKIIASICKVCKQRVSARPYRMHQHLKACKKYRHHGNQANTSEVQEEMNEEDDSDNSNSASAPNPTAELSSSGFDHESTAVEFESEEAKVKRQSKVMFSSSGTGLGRHKDEIWDLFTKTIVDGITKARCNYCSTLVSGRAVRLRQHINTSCTSYVHLEDVDST